MPPDLRAALDTLYRLRPHAPTDMEACPCCVNAESQHRLDRPRRELDVTALGTYPSKAITTWGTVSDYEHYLPRILELSFDASSTGRLGYADNFLASKLRALDANTWPTEACEALVVVAAAQLEHALRDLRAGAFREGDVQDLVEEHDARVRAFREGARE